MTEPQKVPASPVELQTLAESINELKAAIAEKERCEREARRNLTLFCEGKGIPGASFVGISEGHVIVTLPEPAKELESAPAPEAPAP